MTATYTLTSAKQTVTAAGNLSDAFFAALRMDADLQPAGGVTIDYDDRDTYECRNGGIAIEISNDDEDDEAGTVRLIDDELIVCWEQGTRTRFSEHNVIPA